LLDDGDAMVAGDSSAGRDGSLLLPSLTRQVQMALRV